MALLPGRIARAVASLELLVGRLFLSRGEDGFALDHHGEQNGAELLLSEIKHRRVSLGNWMENKRLWRAKFAKRSRGY
jgi:hypothetical protein